MDKDYINKINNSLLEWSGGIAVLWYYTASHSHLEVRLSKENIEGNIHIICKQCYSIHSPTAWKNNIIKVIKNKTNKEGLFEITDKTSGFIVFCDYITLSENVEPIY